MPIVPVLGYEDQSPPDALNQDLIKSVACAWIPDMSSTWNVEYDVQGISGMTQTWLVGRDDRLPVVIRQLLSWNRKRFSNYGSFKDAFANVTSYYKYGLVVTGASLQPMETNRSPAYMAGHMQSPSFKGMIDHYCVADQTVGPCGSGRFPAVLTDKYRLNLQWSRDEYVNRFGINYARVEIAPSIRLESIRGSNLGVIPMDGTGAADEAGAVSRLTIGFPQREAQIQIRVTYPWVKLGVANNNPAASGTILNAGPIGQLAANDLAPGNIPLGQYLGTVNQFNFLGYPRGSVLYQTATLEQRISPATGRLGFQVTHEFLALPSASWNMTRIEGDPTGSLEKQGDAQQPKWPYGYIVAIKKDNTVLLVNDQPVYPYAHKDFANLLYYGWEGGGNLIPTDEG